MSEKKKESSFINKIKDYIAKSSGSNYLKILEENNKKLIYNNNTTNKEIDTYKSKLETTTNILDEYKQKYKASELKQTEINQKYEQQKLMLIESEKNTSIKNDAINNIYNIITELSKYTNSMIEKTLDNSIKLQSWCDGIKASNDSTNDQNEYLNTSLHPLVDTITDVSEKIGLISLNARIEAAHAGEAGKSFTVIAAEVSNLSKTTKENATKIKSSIDLVILSAKGSLDSMNDLEKDITTTLDLDKNQATSVLEMSSKTEQILRLCKDAKK